MTAAPLRLRSRLLLGALAGMPGTAAMTAALSRLHQRLPPDEQYPLPPREITEALIRSSSDETVKDQATLAHFAFGAAGGVLLAAIASAPSACAGAAAGAGIWTASYLGWIAALDILKPAVKHPDRRNALMIGVHLVWGPVTALTLRELTAARSTMLRKGPAQDRSENVSADAGRRR
jgi:hypothetical protein